MLGGIERFGARVAIPRFSRSPAEEVPDAGCHGEPQLRAAPQPSMARGRREDLDPAARATQLPGLETVSGKLHSPFGLGPAAFQAVGQPQPELNTGPIHHHANTAKRPYPGHAKREHSEVQPRGRADLDDGGWRRSEIGRHRRGSVPQKG